MPIGFIVDAVAAIGTFLEGAGIAAGIGEAGLAAGTELGIGAGFASDAAIAGGAGLGAGEAAGLGAAGLATGATFADSLVPATFGTTSGIVDAGAFDATFGGLAGAGAGGAGAGLAASGPPDAFNTLGVAGTETGATFGDSLTPATFGTGSGIIDAGAFDPAFGGLGGAGGAGAASALPPNPVSAPGVQGGIPSTNAASLGATPPTAPGPGAPAFAPPAQTLGTSPIDLTSSFQGAPTDLVTGATQSAPADGFGGVAGGAGATAPENVAALNSPYAAQFTDTGIAAGGNAPTAGGGLLSDAWSGIKSGVNDVGNFLQSPAGKVGATALSLGGLANSLVSARNPNPIPGQADLAAVAKQLGQTGTGLIGPNAAAAGGVAGQATDQAKTLQSYLTTGTLPPAVQASLDQATNSAITNIKARYAARGMPPNSSPEQQEIAALKQNAVIQGGTLAATLYSQGTDLSKLAASIYQGLTGAGVSAAGAGAGALESQVGTGVALNNGVNTAIANLSAALGGGGGIKQGQTFVAQPA